MIKDYINDHLADGRYIEIDQAHAKSRLGWTDIFLLNHAIVSYRKNYYTNKTFSEKLHSHDSYELVAYICGNVEYVNEDLVYRPCQKKLSVVINKENTPHTTRLIQSCTYERYVIYFDRSLLSFLDLNLPFLDYIDNIESFALSFDKETENKLLSLFQDIINTDLGSKYSTQSIYISLLSIFHTICSNAAIGSKLDNIPENIQSIRSYVDINCKNIKNVNAIADSFFYSREHLSRLFKKYFNVTMSDYLAKKKCEESIKLLINGKSIGTSCYECGFSSMTSYLSAFKKNYRMTPSEYLKNKHT